MWTLRFNHLGILDCVILMEDVSQYTQKDLIFIQDFFFNDFDQYIRIALIEIAQFSA